MRKSANALSFTTDDIIDDLKQLRSKRSPEFVSAAAELLLHARKQCDLRLMAEILFEECIYHNHVTSQYKLSNIMAAKCLGICTKLKLIQLQANALRMIGVNYNFLGEFNRASDSFNQGIKLLEGIDDKSDSEKRILAGLYFNLVTLHRDFELDETKIGYIDKCFQLFTEIDDSQGVARTYLLYANFHPEIKGTARVVEYFEKAAKLFEEADDYRGMGNSLVNLGNYYSSISDFEKSMPLLLKGIDYVRKSGSVVYVINGIFNLAIAYKGQKKYEKALETFREVEELMKKSNTGINLTSFYYEWSSTLEESQDHKGALELFKKYHEQKEQINNFDKNATISHAKMLYELEVQRKEADSLRRKNLEIEAYVRKVEVSNFELRQFAHVASHDLKEPLHMVSSYMQLLEKKISSKITEEEREFLNYAKEGAKRMYSLIDSLLALSKINTQTTPEPVDLNVVLQNVIDNLHLEMERRSFRVINPQLPTVMANKTHMHQLFQNLVSNAMKYNQSGEPFVEISHLKSNNVHYFSFCDNGIGIEEKYHTKVFEIFQRLHTREEYSGTGIGLTICKKIVEQLGGKVWIEINKYRGSSFKVNLPIQ